MRKRLTNASHVAAIMAGALLLAGCGTSPPEVPGPISLASGFTRDFSSSPNVSAPISGGVEPSLDETDEGITVTLAGVDVTFTEDDFGAISWLPDGWWKDDLPNGDEAYLLSPGISEFYKYFDIWRFGRTPLDDMGTPAADNTYWFVDGDETVSMPVTGSASYDGGIYARSYRKSVEASESNPNPLYHNSSQTIRYTGDFRMTAEFSGDGITLSGRFENVRNRPGNESEYGQVIDGAMTFTVQASGSRFRTTEVETTGPFAGFEDISIRGGVFGPDADEIGGVFDGQSSDRILTGYFDAHRQPPSTQ